MIELISNSNGTPVRNLQIMLREIFLYENILPEVIVDGIFDEVTKEAVLVFQENNGLPNTGIVDIITFEKIVEKYNKTMRNEKWEMWNEC